MNYAVGVTTYLAMYCLSVLLPTLFMSGRSVLLVAVLSIPLLLVGPRIRQRFADRTPLVPQSFRDGGGFLYGGGSALIALGHLTFFGAIAVAVLLVAVGPVGISAGTVAALAVLPYAVGIVLVEVAFRLWSSGGEPGQNWRQKRRGVFVTVGVVVLVHLGLTLGDMVRPGNYPNLLTFSEREALARGRGYAREVMHQADSFYASQDRVPCANDKYVDVDSLVRGVSRDVSSELSIELRGCGQFVVTVFAPVDGVTNGELFYEAAAGDSLADNRLTWKCSSPHYGRIEQHTRGDCTYDPSAVHAPSLSGRVQGQPAAAEAAPTSANALGAEIEVYLTRLNEPGLADICSASVPAYRVIRVSAEQAVDAVRLWRGQNEFLVGIAISPLPDRSVNRSGTTHEMVGESIGTRLDAAGFWSMPAEGPPTGGAFVYLEGCTRGRYHAIKRPHDDPETASIVDTLIGIGRLP